MPGREWQTREAVRVTDLASWGGREVAIRENVEQTLPGIGSRASRRASATGVG
jgi:hypothetical protein